ncbi:TonB-dependent receptor [Novosphingobium sp. PS1R-30]|uniref:TonB-dependent receptor n=1 Tax=Novosphingobium anseongense TaxID=3133436 RepID=A0ABU8RT69_9SPHN
MLGAASLLTLAWSLPAAAQETAPRSPPPQTAQSYIENGDIIVTARKRQESILKVPVVVTAISNDTLESAQVTQVTDLPRLVPGLVIAGNLLSIGPQVTIRGVGTSSFDPGVDQSISLNIDGLSLGQGLAFGSGMFDVGQVEVLKGPQALFYGKSSPGGVISLRTADPTDEVEVIARGSYEFYAREWRGELIASGPVTETLKARFATTYSEGEGWFRNRAVATPLTGAITPPDRVPQPRNFIVRGTLLWNPTDTFSARFKINHSYDKTINSDLKQLASCPDGAGQSFSPVPGLFPNIPFIGGDDCKYDRNANQVFLDPAAFPGLPNGGTPYLQNKQNFGTLELNYDLSPALSLTSTTAYYKLVSSSSVNPTLTTAAGPTFAVTNNFRRREFTEELRLESDFSGPLNFTLGGFYEDGMLYDRVRFIQNRAYTIGAPLGFLPPGSIELDAATTVDIRTYSLFGQLRYKLSDQLELAGGVRWNDETRTERVTYANPALGDITGLLPEPRVHSSNFSPEATLTYTPSDDLTIFASYKKGYKSGSFKVAVPAAPGEDNAFDDEEVQGYEVGLKSRFFDRSLLFNLAFYDYTYKGLQVGGIADSVGGVPVITTVNAGKARTYGVDVDLMYRPPAIEGLSLSASVNWNHARYKELNNIPCYANQTFAQGCNTFFAPPSGAQLGLPPGVGVTRNGVYGFYNAQDISGQRMIRAPEWTANFGFDYELPVGSGLKLGLTNNNQYSSSYPAYLANGRPNADNVQDSYFRVDASIALRDAEDRWEIALIGKNLTDKLVSSNCSASNSAGGIVLPFSGAYTGGSVAGPMGWAETLCFADGPGRSVFVRLTYRPFN